MVEIARSLSIKVKNLKQSLAKQSPTIDFNDNVFSSNITPTSTNESGFTIMKYDELDPQTVCNATNVNNTSTIKPLFKQKTSSTSLPGLLKRNKTFCGTAKPAGSNSVSSSSTISNTNSTGVLRRQSTSTSLISSPATCVDSVHRQSLSQANLNDLHKLLDIDSTVSTVNELETGAESQRKLTLDLLPPIPLSSPHTETQTSPIYPSRVTSPILEHCEFFPMNDEISIFSGNTRKHSNSNASAFSRTSYMSAMDSLQDEMEDDDEELQQFMFDELAINILEKVSISK